ncbi:ABC-2 type transport system ATP-binding protein [Phytomonospora endophytica]|uniref:ABC-2 type transport system ATP-binding protein n=1 Tax=Phytomonospora endophytica TaxID=714109 RepID=A0A841FDP1_9ACTN|nr:ABC-2 type transport system ATP-binding protein [Phytomonospora endophytica]GIG64899.1 ABC transporter ATP-binding protein [Phytomonospora endophytica]
MSTIALEARALGKKYRRAWGLRDCTFQLPEGRIAALVGPNGAGKSTIMGLATGLLRPTEESIEVFGQRPGDQGSPDGLAFLGQDKPLYKGFTVAEMLRAGRELNASWEQEYAESLLADARIDPAAKIGALSGGQRTRVALAVALGRRPRLLMLDEPLADLDPLAREDVMRSLMAEVAETGMTVLLSSHVIADLEEVCDHLVLLIGGKVALTGDIDDLLAEHRLLIGARPESEPDFGPHTVIQRRDTQRQATVLLRTTAPVNLPDWDSDEPNLEELVLSYLRVAGAQETGDSK